jgi:4-aminobutyrate aminotransferase/(S)-3-amino-2-methylpropionate transaminase
MGPRPAHSEGDLSARPSGVVYATAKGSNVTDVDGNRYVDLAGGFGAMLLGHRHPHVERALLLESERLWQALGDVYPADAKIALCERLAALHPSKHAQVILAQSGSDAIAAALKTALLATGKPGVLAFGHAYHGLGYGALAACGLRESYRAPFAAQLNPHVSFVDYPSSSEHLEQLLEQVAGRLQTQPIGAVLVEPILGRGGIVIPPEQFLPELGRLTHAQGALLIADEIWTGLGRSGAWLFSAKSGRFPDLVCLGKGLGGGLPISAVIGSAQLMQCWSREAEIVHTSTFAGTPLACATAIATLDTLSRDALVERSHALGAEFRDRLVLALTTRAPKITVRGQGMMVALDLGATPGKAGLLARALLERGYITSTGGGQREVLVLTPPLTISKPLLLDAAGAIAEAAGALCA